MHFKGMLSECTVVALNDCMKSGNYCHHAGLEDVYLMFVGVRLTVGTSPWSADLSIRLKSLYVYTSSIQISLI